jgi:hypothetical protein
MAPGQLFLRDVEQGSNLFFVSNYIKIYKVCIAAGRMKEFFWNSVELSKPGSAHPLAQQRECQPPAARTEALHLD